MAAYVYILRCADGSYYVGSTRKGLAERIVEHNVGTYDGYTKRRRPVELVYHQAFTDIVDAISAERRLKGWTRAKKEALIRGDFDALPALSRRRAMVRLSFETAPSGPPQDEADGAPSGGTG